MTSRGALQQPDRGYLQRLCCVDQQPVGPVWVQGSTPEGKELIYCVEHGLQVQRELAERPKE